MDFTLTADEKRILLAAARTAIREKLGARGLSFPEPTPTLRVNCGAFVTLHKQGKLRGCIGQVTASKPLMETVREVAVASALRDPRFPPLQSEELERIEIEISVLSPLEPVKSIEDIQVGTHGIMLRQGFRSGLLLPQVATEYGWDRETFLSHTCQKAGLAGDCWRDSRTQIEIFSAIVFGEKELQA